jgi:hypothetical protein
LNTKRKRPEPSRFIILIPHRDGGLALEEYRRELFASGLSGAFSFPAAAPLALVSLPFDGEELKALAAGMRELSKRNGGDGKFRSAGAGTVASPAGDFKFFGPLLEPWDPDLPSLGGGKVLYRFPALCLCAALLGPADEPAPAVPGLSFGAAMTANLTIAPLDQGEEGYSFAWKTGRPLWLPARGKPKNQEEPWKPVTKRKAASSGSS